MYNVTIRVLKKVVRLKDIFVWCSFIKSPLLISEDRKPKLDIKRMKNQGTTRINKESQGITRIHKESQGITRYHKESQGITRNHKESQGIIKNHKES